MVNYSSSTPFAPMRSVVETQICRHLRVRLNLHSLHPHMRADCRKRLRTCGLPERFALHCSCRKDLHCTQDAVELPMRSSCLILTHMIYLDLWVSSY